LITNSKLSKKKSCPCGCGEDYDSKLMKYKINLLNHTIFAPEGHKGEEGGRRKEEGGGINVFYIPFIFLIFISHFLP
jgi:hypothetical protein